MAIEIHKNDGPGLHKSAYENALAHDLRIFNFAFFAKKLGALRVEYFFQ